VAGTLDISRSSLYYKRKPPPLTGGSAARLCNRRGLGRQAAYGYRRVTWWMQRKQSLVVNGKRVLRVMRERGLLVTPRRTRATPERLESHRRERPNQLWQTDRPRSGREPVSVGHTWCR